MPYLDHNATSPLRPEARSAMERAFDIRGNPSATHASGRAARALVEEARHEVANLANARPEDVTFTSGGTEANALALWGAVQGAADAGAPIERLFVSAIEHDSVLNTAASIFHRIPGIRRADIPATRTGLVEFDELRQLLGKGGERVFVAVMAANNETGVIQPFADIARLVRDAGGLCLIDAVQACGKVATDFAALDADYLTLSAHKLGGPQGIGALVTKESAPVAAQILGGSQERGRRAGTENLMGIAGFGAAARAAGNGDDSRLLALRDRFETGLRRRFPNTVVFGKDAKRLGNTSYFALPGISAETAVIALDLDGVMVSSGAACSSGKARPSHVLKAMGVSADLTASALRVSLGWNSTESDIDAALISLEKLSGRITARRVA
jgi:cysteine desulfurase